LNIDGFKVFTVRVFHQLFLISLSHLHSTRRDKAILSLQAILHKYDVEVGEERTRELEELRAALNMQRQEFGIWNDTVFEPQIRM
jgi:hypothetical protein